MATPARRWKRAEVSFLYWGVWVFEWVAYPVGAGEHFSPSTLSIICTGIEHHAELFVESLWIGVLAEFAQGSGCGFRLAATDEPEERYFHVDG